MPKAVLVVQSSAVSDDRDEEFSNWYRNTHIPQVLAVPGFTSARRYRVRDLASAAPGTRPYLSVYEIDADDPASVMAELTAASRDGRVEFSDSMQIDPPPVVTVYEPID
jgi:hypothetical protein